MSKKGNGELHGIDAVLSEIFYDRAEYHVRWHNNTYLHHQLPSDVFLKLAKRFDAQLHEGVWPQGVTDAYAKLNEELNAFAERRVREEAGFRKKSVSLRERENGALI